MLRGAALGLALLAVVFSGLAIMVRLAFPQVPYGLPPPAPDIPLPTGQPPTGPAGLQLWTQYVGEQPRLAGSAFLLTLPDGGVVGLTAAHNLVIGDPGRALQSIELRIANDRDDAEGVGAAHAQPGGHDRGLWVERLHGAPGSPRRIGLDLSSDHILLRVDSAAAQPLALRPDPRGHAQPGERILLIGGIDGHRHAGTAFLVDPQGIWCLMDADFEPGLLSGSPAVSLHSGAVVGMAVAAGRQQGRLVLGLHPIGPLVDKALTDQAPLRLNE